MHAPFDDVILSLCSCANHLPRPYASECAGMRVEKLKNLFELYNMRKILGAYRFNLLYDRLAG